VAFPLIMSECARLGLGYLAWSWKGNDSSLAYLDMAVDWQGQTLTDWGNSILQAPYGISATTPHASIFAP
jgi:mannan endo-1,4-beta-mannosidase